MTAPCFECRFCGHCGEADCFVSPGGTTSCPNCRASIPPLSEVPRERFLLRHIASELAGVTGPLTGMHSLAIYQLLQREGFIATGGNATGDLQGSAIPPCEHCGKPVDDLDFSICEDCFEKGIRASDTLPRKASQNHAETA